MGNLEDMELVKNGDASEVQITYIQLSFNAFISSPEGCKTENTYGIGSIQPKSAPNQKNKRQLGDPGKTWDRMCKSVCSQVLNPRFNTECTQYCSSGLGLWIGLDGLDNPSRFHASSEAAPSHHPPELRDILQISARIPGLPKKRQNPQHKHEESKTRTSVTTNSLSMVPCLPATGKASQPFRSWDHQH